MFEKWKEYLWWLLPLFAGLTFFLSARFFLPVISPFISTIDFGIVGFVFGTTIRNASAVAFILGFVVAAAFLLVYRWNSRRTSEARTLYADFVQETQRKRRQFLRRLDHEVKNPLTGLRAALVNLQEAQTEDERLQASQNANRAVQRLTRLLTDLRKLADLDERPIERYPVNIPNLLDDVIQAVQSSSAHEEKNISLLIPKVPSPFPVVIGDRDLLALASYNLVENALKFTSTDDSVEVRALEDGRSIIIEVADSGVGIPPEDLSKIFEELYRGSNARSTEGSGLGLALVNRIAALHGGGVGVRSSQNEPRGTVVTLRLPRR